MRKALLVLLILCSPAQAEDPKPPPLELCTLDNKPNEVYYCLETRLDDEVYLAVFAKDGLSAIRVAEIKKKTNKTLSSPGWVVPSLTVVLFPKKEIIKEEVFLF